MIRLASDENFNEKIIRGLLRRIPDLDLRRAHDAGLAGASDERVLEWAAGEGRILLTHDLATMATAAYARVGAGLPMPGVIEVDANLPIGRVIGDLIIVVECSTEGEYEGMVRYLPLSIHLPLLLYGVVHWQNESIYHIKQ